MFEQLPCDKANQDIVGSVQASHLLECVRCIICILCMYGWMTGWMFSRQSRMLGRVQAWGVA